MATGSVKTQKNTFKVASTNVYANNAIHQFASKAPTAIAGYTPVGVLGYFPMGGFQVTDYLSTVALDQNDGNIKAAWAQAVATTMYLQVWLLYIRNDYL